MNDFSPLSDYLSAFTEKLDESQRSNLMRRITQKLKLEMVSRIRSQRDPDGAAFVPRKRNHVRSIRRGALFQRLPRQIKTAYSANHADLGFSGRTAQVMRVHQEGLTTRPSPNTRPVRYAIRRTVGFSPRAEQIIADEIEDFFST